MLARSMLAAVALVSVASVVHAATVTNVVGPVSVNRGGGFTPAAEGTVVGAGDRVSAGIGGGAQIVYGPNCVVKVNAGQTVTIPGVPSAYPVKVKAVEPVCEPAALDPAIIGAGLLLAGTVVGVIALTDNGSNPPPLPISP